MPGPRVRDYTFVYANDKFGSAFWFTSNFLSYNPRDSQVFLRYHRTRLVLREYIYRLAPAIRVNGYSR